MTTIGYALDIETSAIDPYTDNPHALEPYTVDDKSFITSVAVYGPERSYFIKNYGDEEAFGLRILDLLSALEGEVVFAHNALFDVAYLLAKVGGPSFNKIKWMDTIFIEKFLYNGQRTEAASWSNSLVACVKRHLSPDDHPDLHEFLEMKNNEAKPGQDEEYWEKRNLMDAEFTWRLAQAQLSKLKKSQMPGLRTVCKCIVPIASSWITGISVDHNQVDAYSQALEDERKEILKTLGVEATVLTSSKQLADWLFTSGEFPGLEPTVRTPKGSPSVSAEAMALLLRNPDHFDKLTLINKFRRLSTMDSKYVQNFRKAKAYLGKSAIHGVPRILSTKTGRMSYSNKTMNQVVSIAMHQIPRKEKGIKKCLVAPPGYKILYMDVSAQEGRFMAIMGPEPTMIESYNKGIDLHSDLTAEIFGLPYEDIVKANQTGEPKELVENRQAGKLTGLSSFYRIGARSLANKFLTTYGYPISEMTASHYLRAFLAKYPGVRRFWTRSIALAKRCGYAEAIGGWRYYCDNMDWKGESNAINHPIQGSGAMQTYAMIAHVHQRWPQLTLISQVHDSVAYYIPEHGADQVALEISQELNKLDYGEILNFDQTVPIIVDASIGYNLADLTPVGE